MLRAVFPPEKSDGQSVLDGRVVQTAQQSDSFRNVLIGSDFSEDIIIFGGFLFVTVDGAGELPPNLLSCLKG